MDKHKECDGRTVDETDLKQAVVDGMNQVFGNQDDVKSILASTLEKLLYEDSNDGVSTINL